MSSALLCSALLCAPVLPSCLSLQRLTKTQKLCCSRPPVPRRVALVPASKTNFLLHLLQPHVPFYENAPQPATGCRILEGGLTAALRVDCNIAAMVAVILGSVGSARLHTLKHLDSGQFFLVAPKVQNPDLDPDPHAFHGTRYYLCILPAKFTSTAMTSQPSPPRPVVVVVPSSSTPNLARHVHH
ncbi:hypothetical protein BKA81DRAFT_383251 [Phyllosticta paracitricarpa]|uniref:Uncharacterized protein n=1 Tax=Phyllosticta paracitricarpa TaxID=2016321 RepID=A0ABR1MRS1_9PEZI